MEEVSIVEILGHGYVAVRIVCWVGLLKETVYI